jgi:hypothetical protein
MLDGIHVVPVGQVRVMSGLLMIPRFVMLGSFMMVACGMLMLLGCLRVMMGGFFGHILIPFKQKLLSALVSAAAGHLSLRGH